ncbi:SdrD B-like domain-containing protein [Ureibacillus thermosphaericus]|uniref:SdrD B-like domain-containing protein n=1 Tax=Ureibacillus thermosphaericus TaxID=51173 RepID=UPI000BBBD276|nr:SdrD B-like domain-containing protein [Ureibacillus thermosphaericus]
MALTNKNNYYANRTNWYPIKAVGPNISNYIYNDLNRNGVYDVDDQPLMKIAVKMTRPDGTWVVRRSNLNGFANFTHSLTEEKVDVYEPGEYVFEVIVPDGWEITSNNKIQTATYMEAPHTRPGIIVDKVPDPVGIAPILTVSGIVKKREKDGTVSNATTSDVVIKATSPGGKEREVPLEEDVH